MSHRWEDLLPEEFYEEFERAPLAYVAAAAPEEHGLHNPLGVDLWPPYEICLRAAEITGGIVFPLIPFAPAYFPGLSRAELRSREKVLYPPSLFVSRELCELAYMEVFEGLADMGFRACIGMAGHAPADRLMRDITTACNGKIGDMHFFGAGTYSIVEELLDELGKATPGSTSHGTMWETSLVMAIAPEKVDLPRARRILDHPRPSQLHANSPEVIEYIQQANAELGERTIQLAVEKVTKKAQELLG